PAQRRPSTVASTRSIGGFPRRTSTLSDEVGDEDGISISFQSLLLELKATVLEPLAAAARTLSSTSVARSARIGWSVRSLKDTARSSVIASLSADSEVPPRSKN